MTNLYLLTHTAFGKRWFRILFWSVLAFAFIRAFNTWYYWLYG